MCIDSEAWPDRRIPSIGGGIIVDGGVYEVVDVEFDNGYIWYVVEGDDDGSYWENCFARLEDKPAQTFFERIKEKVSDFIKQ